MRIKRGGAKKEEQEIKLGDNKGGFKLADSLPTESKVEEKNEEKEKKVNFFANSKPGASNSSGFFPDKNKKVDTSMGSGAKLFSITPAALPKVNEESDSQQKPKSSLFDNSAPKEEKKEETPKNAVSSLFNNSQEKKEEKGSFFGNKNNSGASLFGNGKKEEQKSIFGNGKPSSGGLFSNMNEKSTSLFANKEGESKKNDA